MYAKSEEGYKNLTNLSSLSYLKNKGTDEPCCELKDLLESSKDLIILTGSYRDFFGNLFMSNKLNDFEKVINVLKKNFINRIYFEVQRHNEHLEKNFENYILNNSKSFKIPLIATQEVFYLHKDMYEAHDALRCIGEKKFVDDKSRFSFSYQHF